MPESDTDRADRNPAEEQNASCSLDQRESTSDRWTKRVWAAGSYEDIAPKYISMGGHLVERTDVDTDDNVLDIGCGTGTVAITAARREARVTGVDIQPALLEHARSNAGISTSNRTNDSNRSPTRPVNAVRALYTSCETEKRSVLWRWQTSLERGVSKRSRDSV